MMTRIILLLLVCTVKLSFTSMMMAFIMPISSSSIVGSRIHNVDGVTTSLRITTNAANDHQYDEDNCNNVNIETTEEQLNSVITSSSRRQFLLTTAPASVVTSSLSAFAATMISSTIAYADEGVPTSADSSPVCTHPNLYKATMTS